MLCVICDKCGQKVYTNSVEALAIKKRTQIGDFTYDLCKNCEIEVRNFIGSSWQKEKCDE